MKEYSNNIDHNFRINSSLKELLDLKNAKLIVQSTLHNSDRFYPDFCIFRTELLSPISFLLKCNTEKVST